MSIQFWDAPKRLHFINEQPTHAKRIMEITERYCCGNCGSLVSLSRPCPRCGVVNVYP